MGTWVTYVWTRLRSPFGLRAPVVCIDGTTANLFYPWAAKQVNEFCQGWHKPKDLKVLVVLRDPVQRAISAYTYERWRGKEPHSDIRAAFNAYKTEDAWFWEKTWPKCMEEGSLGPMYAAHPDPRARDGAYLAIGYREPDRLHYLKRGYYAEHIRRYTEVFGRESVKIVTLDSMMADKALSSTNSILTRLAPAGKHQFRACQHDQNAKGRVPGGPQGGVGKAFLAGNACAEAGVRSCRGRSLDAQIFAGGRVGWAVLSEGIAGFRDRIWAKWL